MTKAQLSAILAGAMGVAGISFTAGQLTTTTDEVTKAAKVIKQRPKNDCQVAIVASTGKAQQVANFLDARFELLCNQQNADFPGSCTWNADDNGIKNLSHKVALASDPSGAHVAFATQFRLPSAHAEWLKTQADGVANVEIGAIEECASENLWGQFDLPGEDGGTINQDRPFKSMNEFLGYQSPALTSWVDPNPPF